MHWKSKEYYTTWMCICRVSYPACNAHASYCQLWPAPLRSTAFCHIIKYTTRFFEKKTLDKKCVFRVSLQHLSETFFIIRINERDKMKILYWYSYKVTFFPYLILMKLEISRQAFEKSSNIKFHEDPSSGSRVVPCERSDGGTDGQTWRS